MTRELNNRLAGTRIHLGEGKFGQVGATGAPPGAQSPIQLPKLGDDHYPTPGLNYA